MGWCSGYWEQSRDGSCGGGGEHLRDKLSPTASLPNPPRIPASITPNALPRITHLFKISGFSPLTTGSPRGDANSLHYICCYRKGIGVQGAVLGCLPLAHPPVSGGLTATPWSHAGTILILPRGVQAAVWVAGLRCGAVSRGRSSASREEGQIGRSAVPDRAEALAPAEIGCMAQSRCLGSSLHLLTCTPRMRSRHRRVPLVPRLGFSPEGPGVEGRKISLMGDAENSSTEEGGPGWQLSYSHLAPPEPCPAGVGRRARLPNRFRLPRVHPQHGRSWFNPSACESCTVLYYAALPFAPVRMDHLKDALSKNKAFLC